jgi:hypothetical protein
MEKFDANNADLLWQFPYKLGSFDEVDFRQIEVSVLPAADRLHLHVILMNQMEPTYYVHLRKGK